MAGSRALGSTTQSGWLNITWGSTQTGAPQSSYSLESGQGEPIRLIFSEPLPRPLDEIIALRGQFVQVTGDWMTPGDPTQGFLVSQIDASAAQALVHPPALLGAQPWVSLLCKFNDVPDEPKSPAYFANMYKSTYPGLDHYWRELSFDQINLTGSTATTQWFTLPSPRADYIYDIGNDGDLDTDFTRITTDCTAAADAEVNFAAFVGINMLFNDNLDGSAWGGNRYLTLDGVTRSWNATWEPPWAYIDIAGIEHEMGYGFGLPHSSGQYGQVYDNAWDVMSYLSFNFGLNPDPVYGNSGQHTIAYHKLLDGWIAPEQVVTVSMYTQTSITLDQLAIPQGTSPLIVKILINGLSNQYYTLEARRSTNSGYDVKLPGSAVIIHRVNLGNNIPATVIDADGNGFTGDDGAMWVVGETFSDATNHIASPNQDGYAHNHLDAQPHSHRHTHHRAAGQRPG